MTTSVLEIHGLTVALPGGAERASAVTNLSISIAAGELVCVVGESGSGKSVTAFSVMGLLPKDGPRPVSGSILLEGRNLMEMSHEELRELRGTRMGMVFQEPMTALNPVFRIGAQIEEVLKIHTDLPQSSRRDRTLSILKAMQLPDPARIYNSFPHELSGGQRQRVVIAMAMILDPALLIADEPTTALDVTTQAQILKLIKDMQTEHGTGVLFITHDFGVVADIADRVVVMRHGEIVEQGPAHQVLGSPQHSYTKSLIAAVPHGRPERRAALDGPELLEVVRLGKSYGAKGFLGGTGIRAASDVNFTLRRKETIGIVGESGSGKTTVARCIARLIDPNEGAIMLDGLDVAHLPERRLRPHRRRIQVVFQDPYRSLNPRRTIEQAIIEGPVNFGLSRNDAKAKALELLRLVGLGSDSLARFPHQFSGGQRQRIALARALAMEPDVLIADEAVSALDVSIQRQVLDLLAEIKERFSLSMLFITHDLRVAAEICDRILVMRSGLVVEQGTAFDVFNEPAQPYTRDLLAAAPGQSFDFAQGWSTLERGGHQSA